jgi:uncharacterized protein (DUF1330 family)
MMFAITNCTDEADRDTEMPVFLIPLFLIIDLKVLGEDLYGQYTCVVAVIVRRNPGRYPARGENVASLAGNWKSERVMLIEFPSKEALSALIRLA